MVNPPLHLCSRDVVLLHSEKNRLLLTYLDFEEPLAHIQHLSIIMTCAVYTSEIPKSPFCDTAKAKLIIVDMRQNSAIPK